MISITGKSEELIAVLGELRDYLVVPDWSEEASIVVSDGTVLNAFLNRCGTWIFNVVHPGRLYRSTTANGKVVNFNHGAQIVAVSDCVSWTAKD